MATHCNTIESVALQLDCHVFYLAYNTGVWTAAENRSCKTDEFNYSPYFLSISLQLEAGRNKEDRQGNDKSTDEYIHCKGHWPNQEETWQNYDTDINLL